MDPFNYPYSHSREVHPNEEVDASGCYGTRELVFQEFLIRQTIGPNPKNLIFELRPTTRKVYPPVVTV